MAGRDGAAEDDDSETGWEPELHAAAIIFRSRSELQHNGISPRAPLAWPNRRKPEWLMRPWISLP